MKTTIKLIGSILFLLSANHVAAQFGNNGFGNQRNQMGGMNQMGSMNQQPTEPTKPKEIPAEEIVGNYMKDMKVALGLDELQTIAISNELVTSFNAHGRIMKLNLPEDALITEYKALTETTDRKVNSFLNKEQREKYIIFKEQAKQPKKAKSKDKKKDKTPENKEK